MQQAAEEGLWGSNCHRHTSPQQQGLTSYRCVLVDSKLTMCSDVWHVCTAAGCGVWAMQQAAGVACGAAAPTNTLPYSSRD
jgi:hypothetical protein